MNLQVRINKVSFMPQLWMHREDKDSGVFLNSQGEAKVRDCAVGGCPAVFVLNEPRTKVLFTKDWQYYLIAINYGMTLVNIAKILDDHLAFANQTGLFSTTPRKNFILAKDLNAREYPKLDKDRTCSRNSHAGVEIGDLVKLTTFDGNKAPPLKPGKTYPNTIAEIRLEDYLYNPKDHPYMFVVANTVSVKAGDTTSVAPFPRGAIYSWTKDNLPYTFLPLVSDEVIYYPKSRLIKLDMSKPLPSPYRIV